MTESVWHREEIKAAVRKTGLTLTELSLSKGLPEHACRAALAGRHPAGEAAISEYIKVPLWVLWPGRWRQPRRKGDPAIRIDHRRCNESRTGRAARHRQKHKGSLT